MRRPAHVLGSAVLVAALLSTVPMLPVAMGTEPIRFEVVPGTMGPSGPGPTTVRLVNETADGIDAWSFGLCHDPSVAEVTSAEESTELIDLLGGPPDFACIELDPDGIRVYAIVSFLMTAALPPGDVEVATIEYAPVSSSAVAAVTFCETLGSPTIEHLVVIGQFGVAAGTLDGHVPIGGVGPVFRYRVPDAHGSFDPTTGVGSLVVSPVIVEESDQVVPATGFSMGLAHDPALLTATFVQPAGPLLDLAGGLGPDFFGVTIYPDGITVDVLYRTGNVETIDHESEGSVIFIDYVTVPAAFAGVQGIVPVPITFLDTIGTPGMPNLMTTGSSVDPVLPVLEHGVVTLNALGTFVRGECNGDGLFDLGDPVRLLDTLFSGAAIPVCLSACDANDDSGIDIADVVYQLSGLFINGPLPPAPFPSCGPDPTADTLPCDVHDPCL